MNDDKIEVYLTIDSIHDSGYFDQYYPVGTAMYLTCTNC